MALFDTTTKKEKVLRKLLAEGKVTQSRLEDDYKYPMKGNTGCWVESDDQIEWSR